MLVRTGKGTTAEGNGADRDALEIHDSLAEVVDTLLAEG